LQSTAIITTKDLKLCQRLNGQRSLIIMNKRFTYFYSLLFQKWGIFDEHNKMVSHYEESESKAFFCCMRFNREALEGKR